MKLSTFAKNRKQGYWYLTKQYYMVPIECAAALGKAIIAASKGRPFGDPPAWWENFQNKYREWKARKAAGLTRRLMWTGPTRRRVGCGATLPPTVLARRRSGHYVAFWPFINFTPDSTGCSPPSGVSLHHAVQSDDSEHSPEIHAKQKYGTGYSVQHPREEPTHTQ